MDKELAEDLGNEAAQYAEQIRVVFAVSELDEYVDTGTALALLKDLFEFLRGASSALAGKVVDPLE